jgi:hypothetical protein
MPQTVGDDHADERLVASRTTSLHALQTTTTRCRQALRREAVYRFECRCTQRDDEWQSRCAAETCSTWTDKGRTTVKRTVAVAFWAFVGAVLGFLVGAIAVGLADRAYPDMDEFEYVVVGLLVPVVATVVGALIGGVVGARVERR